MTKLIHESAFSDNPVTDNRYHGITSLSRMQVCQSSTLELHYKGRQLKFTLDTGVTVSLITESICRFAGIPVLPATQRPYLRIIGEINIYLNCEETPPLDLTVLVVPKLGCEILAGTPFIMSNQIIINTPKSVITIHNKYDVSVSSFGHSKSIIIRSPINRVLFRGDSIPVPVPQDFIIYHEFMSSATYGIQKKLARTISYQE